MVLVAIFGWAGGPQLWHHFKRDVLMFALGAGGFIHELFFQASERPTVLFVCCALMGLPFVLNGRSSNGKK